MVSGEYPALRKRLDALLQRGGVIVGENGRTVFTYRSDSGPRPASYVPASILKIATALAALHYLGPDYRFRTEVYRQGNRLYLKGYGDPLLVSEEWRLIAGELRELGQFSSPLGALVLDDTAFAGTLNVDGAVNSLNPYDAPLGALVSNFNTIFLTVAPNGKVTSAEPQTPLTGIGRRLGRGLSPGKHRFNLSARGISGLAHTGELARAIFEEEGARFTARPRPGKAPAGLAPILVHRSSHDLRKVVADLMEFSNNYIANQLVLILALEKTMKRKGEPVKFTEGVELLRRYLREEQGLRPEQFHLEEGSGLSRRNRITLEAMLTLTDAFYPWRHLLTPRGKEPFRLPAKTGSLRGVYTLAGYLPAPPGTRRPFVVMLNQRRHTRGAVVREVWKAFAGHPSH